MEEYLESWFLESGIQLKESWIPLTIGIRNPSSTNKESGIQYLESEIQNPRLSWIPLKPDSYMPPMYLRRRRRYRLGYFSDEWEHAPPATGAIAELYRRIWPVSNICEFNTNDENPLRCMCEVRRLKWASPFYHKTAKHFRCIKYKNINR